MFGVLTWAARTRPLNPSPLLQGLQEQRIASKTEGAQAVLGTIFKQEKHNVQSNLGALGRETSLQLGHCCPQMLSSDQAGHAIVRM